MKIIYINFILSISATLSLCMFSVIFLKKYVGINSRYAFCKIISLAISFLILVSFILLAYAFLTDDFSLRYVANNSNINLDTMYKFSAVWGAHEGSILLWVLILSLWSACIPLFSGKIPKLGTSVKNFKIDDSVCAILGGGGYAEFVNVDFKQVMPIPKNINIHVILH